MGKKVSKELEKKFMEIDLKIEKLWENERWDECIELYLKIYDLLPEPKDEYEDVHWIYGTIGYLYAYKNDVYNAKKYYEKTLKLSVYSGKQKQEMDAGANWYLGQFCFNEGDKQKALEYFAKAYGFLDMNLKKKHHVEFVKENMDKVVKMMSKKDG